VSEVEEILALAVRIAREAGAIQRERYETELAIATKSAPIDLVTEVDRACERCVVEALARERPRDALLAEEGSRLGDGASTWRWIVDPLDGTVNFAHGYPRFCISIGVEREGARQVGVVYDPLLDELYHAVAGAGAFRNGRRLAVSRETELSRALLCTGFAYDVHQSETDNVRQFVAALKSARGLRRDGSAALDLAYVAAGRLDGFWEQKLHPWDVAAGILLVEEAGGRATDLAGEPAPASGREIAASNGALHDALLRVLRQG
jgi:myo-inositol-1(or 4)-monophosphatase